MFRQFRQFRLVRSAGVVFNMPGETTFTKPVAKGRTLCVQSSLPKLPVPPLEKTLQKYLRTVRPLVTDEEFSKTKAVVKNFAEEQGPQLQRLLEKRAQEQDNWLSDWWKNVTYLDSRIPLVVNFNPAVVFPVQKYCSLDGQIRFAAKFVAGVLDYKSQIDDQSVHVESLGGSPLCMMQYYQIMSACRVPGLKKDKHVIYPSNKPNAPRHICVIHNNHIFSVPVYDGQGHTQSWDQLTRQLLTVVEQSQQKATGVGLLTTLDRDTWAHVYHDMIRDPHNAALMEEIHRSIFVLCLDQPTSVDLSVPENRSVVAAQMLHGGGADLNSGNRWFDKTLQFIIGANGACGLNYEHTTAEGPPIATIFDYVLDYVEHKRERHLMATMVDPPVRLDFYISNKASDAIGLAKQQIATLAKDVQLSVFTFEDYGKDFIKSCRQSPDAYIQVALQLSFYRLFRQPCATYETASLRRFQLGRTDTIRSCSSESYDFCKAFDECVGDNFKVTLLKNAIKAHRQYTDDAVAGLGVDRHLLGLKLAALEAGLNIPDIFMDTAFVASTYFRLSTSQVAAKHDAVMCFGPVVPDGFGICYNPQNCRLNFSVSAFHTCSETNSEVFINVLKQSLKDMHKLLCSTAQQARL